MVTIADGRPRMRALIHEALDQAFQPVPDQSMSEWADEHFRLPPTAAQSGMKYSTDRVPYLRRIIDVLGDLATREVVFAKSSQVGGSTVGEIFIAERIARRPRAILSIWPSEKKLKDFSRLRLNPLLENVPALASKFQRSRRREASDTLTRKEFDLGWLALLTAKSTSDLKSLSAPDIVMEELDEWDPEVGDQGDPVFLAERANLSYPWGKTYKTSTPTMDGASRIWSELEQSTWNEYWVPCPHCEAFQTLRWRDGDEDPDAPGAYRLLWEKDAGGGLIPGTCRYVCASCDEQIPERWKMGMLTRGEWRPRFPGRFVEGFHINTLYSPLSGWDKVARAFMKGKRSPAEMKVFVNTFLGLPYRQQGEKHLDVHFLARRAESYGAGIEVPDGVGILVAGVDVQSSDGGWLDCHLWGLGADEESWFISHDQLEGDPAKADVWEVLEQWRLRAWRHASGAPLRIAAMAIDANHQPEMVHRYCDPRAAQQVIPVIGRGGPGRRILRAPAVQKFRKGATRRYRPSYIVGVDTARAILYARLGVTVPGPEYVHFPEGLDQAWYEQLTAHRMTTVYRGGIPFRAWQRIPDRRKEAEDGALYAMAALQHLGAPVIRQLGELAQQLREWKPPLPGTKSGPARGGLVSEVEW